MPGPIEPVIDGIWHGLFSTVDPLGMVLRTLMGLLSDALAQLVTGAYAGLFAVTTVDFSTDAVGSIWRITTGLSVGLATVLLVVAAFRGMFAQSSRYVLQALPGVVAAVLGPQAAAVLLPVVSAGLTDLAEVIVTTATPDLAESMRLLAGVGSNPIYEGLGLLAPIIATLLLFGMSMVFVVLLFCMAAAVVLFVLSPFAFAGLVMPATRAWFTRWATAMFAVLFAKVPIAILLALSVSLFADSRYAGTTQSFVNAAAGLILGVGALLSPLLGYGLFSFMGAVATRPHGIPGSPGSAARAVHSTRSGLQLGRAGINGTRSAVTRLHTRATPPPAAGEGDTARTGPGTGAGTVRPGPHEPSAAQRAAGHVVAAPSPASGPSANASTRQSPTTAGRASAGRVAPVPNGGSGGGSSAAGASGPAGSAAVAGSVTAGVGAAAVLAAQAGARARDGAKRAVTSAAGDLSEAGDQRRPVGRGGAFGSPGDHRADSSTSSEASREGR